MLNHDLCDNGTKVQNPRPVCTVSGQQETADVDGTLHMNDIMSFFWYTFEELKRPNSLTRASF